MNYTILMNEREELKLEKISADWLDLKDEICYVEEWHQKQLALPPNRRRKTFFVACNCSRCNPVKH